MITSSTTCSGKAVESTIIVLSPPVSAINGTNGPFLAAKVRLILNAVAFDPVKDTPPQKGCSTNAAPTAPSPTTNCNAPCGTPASNINFVASKAIIGVCSAGFAITAFPAINAATTCPVKMANGKFHGLIQTKTPRPSINKRFSSPVGPGSNMPSFLKMRRPCAA